MTAINAQRLAVWYGEQLLAGPVNLVLDHGTTLGLRGPSGAGKSTLLRALVGLLPPELRAEGSIEVLGIDVRHRRTDLPAVRARVSLVGQTPTLFPGSVLHNTLFGLRHLVRLSRFALIARAEAVLAEAGLWAEVCDRLDAPAHKLSIGQRQRLCLARALAIEPEVLLVDEPTSALDANAADTVEAAIAGLRSRRSVVIVSHDEAQLERLCDDVVLIEPRERMNCPIPTQRLVGKQDSMHSRLEASSAHERM